MPPVSSPEREKETNRERERDGAGGAVRGEVRER